MWFAKLFGVDRGDDSEPSEHPPHPASVRGLKAPPVDQSPHSVVPKKTAPPKGFDPYNSGGFDKNKAWSRVIR